VLGCCGEVCCCGEVSCDEVGPVVRGGERRATPARHDAPTTAIDMPRTSVDVAPFLTVAFEGASIGVFVGVERDAARA
jgi:hypothetical protein